MNKPQNTYIILKEKKLIIEVLQGEFTIDSYINFKSQEIANPDFSSNYNVITCLRNVDVKSEVQDLDNFIHFAKTMINAEVNKKIAIVTATPSQVVIGTLFKIKQLSKLTIVEIFSERISALSWLGFTNNEIEFLIKKMQ